MKKIFLSLCFLIAFINGKAQNLSNTEKKIVAYINEHLPETKDLLVKQSTSIVEH
jgi:DNA-binding MurR/RpiR family transcriptional regulator